MSGKQVVERVESAVYTVATDGPEADGTLAWDSTTLVLATVRCGDVTGLGYTYAPAAAAHVIDDLLAGVVKQDGQDECPIERAGHVPEPDTAWAR
ncbi:hypothetical protein AB0A91_20300 [Streptomyces sp. NPDC042207]|uniref:hypothetical protein n=1 Tax=Streptomyces sp. NPDC042207 TaxID=3154331 RepID=UPI0033F3E525